MHSLFITILIVLKNRDSDLYRGGRKEHGKTSKKDGPRHWDDPREESPVWASERVPLIVTCRQKEE